MRLTPRPAALVAASVLAPASVFAAPTDVVPRGDIAYDLLGSLAAAGRLPGYTLADFARGDRLYTRAEVARIVALLPEDGVPLADRQAAAVRVLRAAFAPELARLGQARYANSAPPAARGEVTGFLKPRLLTGPAAGTATLRASAVQPIGRDAFAAVVVSNFREEWYATRRFDPSNRGANYGNVETAFVRLNGRVLDVSVGRMPLRWGAGYAGGLLFNDEAAAVPQIRVEKGFRLPGRFGRSVGPLYFTQFYGQFFEDPATILFTNQTGTRRHLLGRRLETNGGGRWNLALSEGLKSAQLPDPLWSQVLPYYLYQNDWNEGSRRRWLGFLATDAQPNTYWKNYNGEAEVTYRAGGERGATFYVNLLLDDYRAPRAIGMETVTPRKVGQQYGVYAPNLDGTGRYAARLEVASFDPEVYTNVSPPVPWSQQGVGFGHPSGGNNTTVFARFDAQPVERLGVAVEASARRRRESRPGILVPPDADRVGIYGVYSLRPNVFVGSRLEYLKVSPVGATAGSRDTRFELNAGAGF